MCEQRGFMNSIRVVYENEVSILSQRVCKFSEMLRKGVIYHVQCLYCFRKGTIFENILF